MTLIKKFVLVMMFLTSSNVFASKLDVSQTMFGERWPFTLKSGTLQCLKDDSVIFISGSKAYALNGVAKKNAKKHDLRKVDSIWKEDPSYSELVMQIAESDPNMTYEQVRNTMGTPPKINIGPILDKGLSLCK